MFGLHLNKLSLAVLTLIATAQSNYSQNFGGTIGANEPLVSFNHNIPVTTSAIACIFGIQSAQFSNVIMVANTTPISLSLDRQSLSSMYLQKSHQLKYMDLPSTIGNRLQLVNLPVPPNSTNVTVYLVFYNLDLPLVQTPKVYSLSIRSYDSPGLACFTCPPSTSYRDPSSCKCSPCATDYYGDSCQYEVPTMKEGRQYTSTFYSMANSYYRIANPPQNITITYRQSQLTHKINLYIQFQLTPGDIAGQLNAYYNEFELPYSKLLTTTQSEFTFPTHGMNIAITLHSNENTPPTTTTIKYRDANAFKALALTLGLSLGLGLPLVLFIIIYCLYRRYRKKKDLPVNSFLAQKKELNFYFPEILASVVFSLNQKIQESFQQLNASRDEGSSRRLEQERTCVVCLNSIDLKSKIRVTYCRHIFHSHCLMTWFKKNENCPFCRHDCSINVTQEAFQKLKGQNRQFRKKDLVAAIIQQKKTSSTQAVGLLVKQNIVNEVQDNVKYEIEDSREYQPTEVVEIQSRKKHRRKIRGRRRDQQVIDQGLSDRTSQLEEREE